MLVLARKLHEVIYIGDNITLTIMEIDRNVVRVGIEAPKDVRIFRKELWDREHPPREEKENDK